VPGFFTRIFINAEAEAGPVDINGWSMGDVSRRGRIAATLAECSSPNNIPVEFPSLRSL
jgi:hypothetical protein